MDDERPDLRIVKPMGTFHAVKTRDAVARERDGETYYAINNLPSAVGITWEIMFEDGTWMLAQFEDLDF